MIVNVLIISGFVASGAASPGSAARNRTWWVTTGVTSLDWASSAPQQTVNGSRKQRFFIRFSLSKLEAHHSVSWLSSWRSIHRYGRYGTPAPSIESNRSEEHTSELQSL